MKGPTAKGSTALTTVIEIHDKEGRKVGEKEVATYQGLLAKAHDEGLRLLCTAIVQFPSKENGQTAIVSAEVRTGKGRFVAIGDASPENVNRRVARHFIRMAETRAKARALRDAVNIGLVSMEELSDLSEDELDSAGTPPERPATPARTGNGAPNGAPPAAQDGTADSALTGHEFHALSDAQRRLLFRLAAERGIAPENASKWLLAELGVPDFRGVSRHMASRLIDRLRSDGHDAPTNGASA